MGRPAEALDELEKIDGLNRELHFYETRGGIYLQMNELQRAAEDFEQIVRLDPMHSFHYLKAAPLLVATGDVESYQRLCSNALDRFSKSASVSDLERIVKISSILQLDDPILQERVEPVREVLGPNPGLVWAKLTTVLSEYRRGNEKAAIQRANECLVISREKEKPTPPPDC